MGKKGLQFVWPKDGDRGRSGHRGFFGGLNEIMGNRGPDMFLQRKGCRHAIKPDVWGNWDSYHCPAYHVRENGRGSRHPLFSASRGSQRYDPNTRRYTEWSIPHDWGRERVNRQNQAFYPRFTQDEALQMMSRIQRGRNPTKPRGMGSEWTSYGPKRFRQEHDWFWQQAHRFGENEREGFSPLSSGINQNMRMHQRWPDDLREWVKAEPWFPGS